jgi:RIO kinase 1
MAVSSCFSLYIIVDLECNSRLRSLLEPRRASKTLQSQRTSNDGSTSRSSSSFALSLPAASSSTLISANTTSCKLPLSRSLTLEPDADSTPVAPSYHEGHLWVIDVSQSVEQDHPAAFDFLRSDIQNANDFFARRGVDTLGLTRTFNYVTRASWISGRPETDEDMAIEAERLLALAEVEADDVEEEDEGREAGREAKSKPSASDEAVFAQSYIPRALDQVYDIERDVARVLKGEGSDLIYADITGVADIRKKEAKASGVRFDDGQALSAEGTSLKTNLIEGQGEKAGEADGEGEDAEESGSGSGSEEDEDSEEDYDERRPKGKKFEDKDEKKVRLLERARVL